MRKSHAMTTRSECHLDLLGFTPKLCKIPCLPLNKESCNSKRISTIDSSTSNFPNFENSQNRLSNSCSDIFSSIVKLPNVISKPSSFDKIRERFKFTIPKPFSFYHRELALIEKRLDWANLGKNNDEIKENLNTKYAKSQNKRTTKVIEFKFRDKKDNRTPIVIESLRPIVQNQQTKKKQTTQPIPFKFNHRQETKLVKTSTDNFKPYGT